MKRLVIFFVTLFALCLFAIPASAATSDDVVVSFTVAEIYDIAFITGTWTPTVGNTEITAGEVEDTSVDTMTYKANETFDITAYYTDTGTATWPGAWTLQMKDDTLTVAYHTIPGTTPDDYCTAQAAGTAGCTTDWKLSGLLWTNTPAGDYEATVTFTIEAG